MGTAHPLVDLEQGDGTYYSPRRVGAGQVDALAATTSSVYPTVVGAANPSRPRLTWATDRRVDLPGAADQCLR